MTASDYSNINIGEGGLTNQTLHYDIKTKTVLVIIKVGEVQGKKRRPILLQKRGKTVPVGKRNITQKISKLWQKKLI